MARKSRFTARKSRAGWLQKELGLQLVHNEKMSGRHGAPVSFEYIAQENPDWIYALDRLAAIGEDGASAKQTLDNELVHGTTAWKKGQVVYLPPETYLAAGGAQELLNAVNLLKDAFSQAK